MNGTGMNENSQAAAKHWGPERHVKVGHYKKGDKLRSPWDSYNIMALWYFEVFKGGQIEACHWRPERHVKVRHFKINILLRTKTIQNKLILSISSNQAFSKSNKDFLGNITKT